ncbi:MAG: T9SS type A sorting domain-containing protein [Bacteroidia bacterium]
MMTKSTILLSSTLLWAAVAFCQTPITINAADMPVPTIDYNIDEITATLPPQPTFGSNQNWDYSSYVGNSISSFSYLAETDPFFTNAGIDVYFTGLKKLNASVGYDIAHEMDFNANKIEYKGLYVYPQSYTLEAFTGNIMDKIEFSEQKIIYPNGRTTIQFPFTANSSWHSTTSRIVVNFKLSVASAGLNATPGQQVFRYTENDSVVGWGKLRVHTAGGSSIPYDVLMLKVESYATDSMYLGGAPAPTSLLNAFGITQGQKSDSRYAYNFHRKGSWFYLMRRYYGADNTYTNLNGSWISTDNITVDVEDSFSYSTLFYPNPTNGNELNIQITGKNTLCSQYKVIDMMGRTVETGKPFATNMNDLKVQFNENLANGTYFLQLLDNENQSVLMEKFELLR